jgi:hypothetical protein
MDLPGFLPLKLDLPDILPRLFPGLDPQYSFLAVFVTAAVGLPALLLWMFLKIMAEDDWDPKDKVCLDCCCTVLNGRWMLMLTRPSLDVALYRDGSVLAFLLSP